MDRIFLDANVLFSAAWSSTTQWRRLWALPRTAAVLISSDHVIAEARRNLPPAKHPVLERLLSGLELVQKLPRQHWQPLQGVELPDGDMAILQAAIRAQATHLLTGDRRHFGPLYLQSIRDVLILPPSDYLQGHDDEP